VTLQSIPKEKRKLLPPPFVVAAEVTITQGHELALKHLAPDDPDRLVLCAYCDRMQQLEPEAKTAFIMDELRYVRVRTTWDKTHSMLEIGFGPLCEELTKRWF
jgi:hypothetical protein